MESYAISLFIFLFHILDVTLAQVLQLPLGSQCENNWTCQKADNCKNLGDFKISRPKICSFTADHKAIMCCPPNHNLQQSTKKAEEVCQGFVSHLCNVSFQKRHADIDSSKPKRVRRQEFFLAPINRPSVVGGHFVKPRTHRHMALIGYGDSLNSVSWECGGSIISNTFILSAAHCAENNARQVARWARVGDLDVASNTDDARPVTMNIVQRIVHPDYNKSFFYNDIALFRLEESLFFNPWIAPACLSTEKMPSESYATVTGWGRTDIVGDTSSHLLAVDLSLVAPNECKTLHSTSRKLPNGINTASMICAGEKEGGKDSCSGDSGGPLIINATSSSCLKTQIGVISFGKLCALPNSPGVYSKVSHFLPWISSIVWT